MPDLPIEPAQLQIVERLDIQEVITRMTVLAAVLDEQNAPLRAAKYPSIPIDPHQMARLVRMFFLPQGAA